MGADGTPITVTVVVHVLGESFAAPTPPFTGADITGLSLVALAFIGVGIVLTAERRGAYALEPSPVRTAECERRPRCALFDLPRPVDQLFIWS